MSVLDQCVKDVLCPLGNSVRGALNGIIEGQIAFLQAQVVSISTTLMGLQIQLLPLEAARVAAEAVLASVKSAANLVPINLMAGCADLGLSMADINNSLDDATAAVNAKLNELNRSLAYKLELEEEREECNRIIGRLRALQSAMAECT